MKWVDENVDSAKFETVCPPVCPLVEGGSSSFGSFASAKWNVRHLPAEEVKRCRLEALKNCFNVEGPQIFSKDTPKSRYAHYNFTIESEHKGSPMALNWHSNTKNSMRVDVFPCCGQVVMVKDGVFFSQGHCTQKCDCLDHGVPVCCQSNKQFKLEWSCECNATKFRLVREPAPTMHRIESVESVKRQRDESTDEPRAASSPFPFNYGLHFSLWGS